MIRAAIPADIPAICALYNHYILHTHHTFQEVPMTQAAMAERVAAVQQQYPWLVAVEDELLLGYAYATAWKPREAYRYTVESSIYLAPAAQGRGVGTRLYQALLDELRKLELHAVLGGISLPNAPSIALHEKLGFEKVGQLREVGFKMGRYIDVGYWQLKL